MSKDWNGHGRNGPRCVTVPRERLPSVVVTPAPTAKQWPAVVRKRWPDLCTTKPEEHTEPPLLIELPPQNGEVSLRRSNESRTAASCCSMTPANCFFSGAV